jgi:hypothetical protein
MRKLSLPAVGWIAMSMLWTLDLIAQSGSSDVIKVTKTQILIGNKSIAESDFANTYVISQLSEELAKNKSDQITIDAEQDVPFIVLLKVIITVGRNNCSKIKLKSGNEIFAIQLPGFVKDESNKPFSLKVVITNNGITLADNGKLFEEHQSIAKLTSGEYDMEKLKTVLGEASDKMKEKGLWDRHMTILTAEDETTYETVTITLRAVYAIEPGIKYENETWHNTIGFGRIVK